MSKRSIRMVLAACLMVVVAGCSDAKQRIESSGNLKELSRAVLKYEADNDAWPEALADLESVIGTDDDLGPIGGGKDYATLLRNPLTGDDPGYEYVTPPASRRASAAPSSCISCATASGTRRCRWPTWTAPSARWARAASADDSPRLVVARFIGPKSTGPHECGHYERAME